MASLEALRGGEVVFSSDGRWLVPLLELDAFLAETGIRGSDLSVRDRVVGRAAALMLAGLGVAEVEAGILSRSANDVLGRFTIPCRWRELVDAIGCATERELAAVWDPDVAWALVRERAARSRSAGMQPL